MKFIYQGFCVFQRHTYVALKPFLHLIFKQSRTDDFQAHGLGIRKIYPRIESLLKVGPTEIRTRAAGFKVQSANHYTMGPHIGNINDHYFFV